MSFIAFQLSLFLLKNRIFLRVKGSTNKAHTRSIRANSGVVSLPFQDPGGSWPQLGGESPSQGQEEGQRRRHGCLEPGRFGGGRAQLLSSACSDFLRDTRSKVISGERSKPGGITRAQETCPGGRRVPCHACSLSGWHQNSLSFLSETIKCFRAELAW